MTCAQTYAHSGNETLCVIGPGFVGVVVNENAILPIVQVEGNSFRTIKGKKSGLCVKDNRRVKDGVGFNSARRDSDKSICEGIAAGNHIDDYGFFCAAFPANVILAAVKDSNVRGDRSSGILNFTGNRDYCTLTGDNRRAGQLLQLDGAVDLQVAAGGHKDREITDASSRDFSRIRNGQRAVGHCKDSVAGQRGLNSNCGISREGDGSREDQRCITSTVVAEGDFLFDCHGLIDFGVRVRQGRDHGGVSRHGKCILEGGVFAGFAVVRNRKFCNARGVNGYVRVALVGSSSHHVSAVPGDDVVRFGIRVVDRDLVGVGHDLDGLLVLKHDRICRDQIREEHDRFAVLIRGIGRLERIIAVLADHGGVAMGAELPVLVEPDTTGTIGHVMRIAFGQADKVAIDTTRRGDLKIFRILRQVDVVESQHALLPINIRAGGHLIADAGGGSRKRDGTSSILVTICRRAKALSERVVEIINVAPRGFTRRVSCAT